MSQVLSKLHLGVFPQVGGKGGGLAGGEFFHRMLPSPKLLPPKNNF